MILLEISAENLVGADRPLRFLFGPSYNQFDLPPRCHTTLPICIRSLLYPQDFFRDQLSAVARNEFFQCALEFEISGRAMRVQRGRSLDSVILHLRTADGGLQVVARGAKSVESTLHKLLGLCPLEVMNLLNLADFSSSAEPRRLRDAMSPRDMPGLPQAPITNGSAPRSEISRGDSSDRPSKPLAPGRADEPKVIDVSDQYAFGLVSLTGEEAGVGEEGKERDDSTADPLSFGLIDPLTPPTSQQSEAHETEPLRPGSPSLAQAVGPPETVEPLEEQYRRAKQAELLDSKITTLQARLDQIVTELRQFTTLDQELQQIQDSLATLPGIDKVSEEERSVLDAEEIRRQQLHKRLDTLNARIAAVTHSGPRRVALWRNPIFMLGVVATLACTAISVWGPMRFRPVALVNVICLGGALIGFLQYLRERAAYQKIKAKLDILKRQLGEVQLERQTFERQLAEIRRKSGVQSNEQLLEAVAKREELTRKQKRLIDERETQRNNPQYRTLNDQRNRLEKELDLALRNRGKLGECPLTSEQIAQELAYLNVTVSDRDFASAATSSPSMATEEQICQTSSGLRDLYDIIAQLELVENGEPRDEIAELWQRILSKLIGRPIPKPRLFESGRIDLMGAPATEWEALSMAEQYLYCEALALAVLIRAVGRVEPSPLPLVLRFAPFDVLSPGQAKNLDDFYQRLARHMQVGVFTAEGG